MFSFLSKKCTFTVIALFLAVTSLHSIPAHAADDHSAHAKQGALYYCPMHPQIVSDKPGDCPICHMRLVLRGSEPEHKSDLMPTVTSDPKSVCIFHDCPMEKGGGQCPMLIMGEQGEVVQCPVCNQKMKMQAELVGTLQPVGYSTVLISAQKQQLIGIRTALVQKKEIKRLLRTSARVAYDPELYEAQIDYLREYRTSQGTLRNRESAFKNLTDSRWEAPRIEVAKSKLVLKGMDDEAIEELVKDAKADETLLYLKPDSTVWVYADVFESELAWLHKGETVRLEVPSAPGKNYEGTVQSIGSMVDAASRRVRVRVRIKNDGFLKPEMLLNAVIESSYGEGLAVPEEAVFLTGSAAIVFVDKGSGLFEPHEVTVGIKAGDDYQVLSGLNEGEKIVVNGNFLLDSESRLKASIEQAAALHAGHGAKHDPTT